jgi:hypothetical protein
LEARPGWFTEDSQAAGGFLSHGGYPQIIQVIACIITYILSQSYMDTLIL